MKNKSENFYLSYYNSPIGKIALGSDGHALVGLWFEGAKYYCEGFDRLAKTKDLSIFNETKRWLDIYFSGKEPDFMPEIKQNGSDFRLEVWQILKEISYGKTITYGEIAQKIAKKRGLKRISAQAVGSAVGHNSVSIIVPCHRVVGAKALLTGYAGGLDKKKFLLGLEGIDTTRFKDI